MESNAQAPWRSNNQEQNSRRWLRRDFSRRKTDKNLRRDDDNRDRWLRRKEKKPREMVAVVRNQ